MDLETKLASAKVAAGWMRELGIIRLVVPGELELLAAADANWAPDPAPAPSADYESEELPDPIDALNQQWDGRKKTRKVTPDGE